MPVRETPIKNVSDTAIWVANYRAQESERSDALFHDPLAARLAGDRGKEIAHGMGRAWQIGWAVVVRTCIIDELITAAINNGVDTVLNLGAGLDTRPYRMQLPPKLKWIEVDFPDMIEYKETLLENEKPVCDLTRIKLDLRSKTQRATLFAQINAQAMKALVLTEGVVPYLLADDVRSLAADLHAQAKFQLWIVDYFSPVLNKYFRRSSRLKKMRNAPFHFQPDDWFGFFTQCQWRLKEMRYMAPEAKRLGREPHLPFWAKVMMFFASKKRQELFLHSSGYALLEPII